MIEGNVGYTGSENFNKGQRYGLFPSIALGWIPSQYEFFQKAVPFISYLKFRGSYGQVGNDRLKDVRFPYLTIVGGIGSGIWGGPAIGETQVGSTDMEWETTTKLDIGIDGKLFDNKVDFTVDFSATRLPVSFKSSESVPNESA